MTAKSARIVVDNQHGLALETVERFTRQAGQRRRLRSEEIADGAGGLGHFLFDPIDQPRMRFRVIFARPEEFNLLAVVDGM